MCFLCILCLLCFLYTSKWKLLVFILYFLCLFVLIWCFYAFLWFFVVICGFLCTSKWKLLVLICAFYAFCVCMCFFVFFVLVKFFLKKNKKFKIGLITSIYNTTYRCLKDVIHRIDSKKEWLLLSASFTAKFRLVFLLTLENTFSQRFHFKGNRRSIDSSKKRYQGFLNFWIFSIL